ncbi:MAG: DNA methyltransferase [Nitrososphaerota archaeon]
MDKTETMVPQIRGSGEIGEAIIPMDSRLDIVSKIDKLGVIESSVHTPVYQMHKFWARRPWKVFRKLIQNFTREGDIILDPFAGGGVTLVEGLILRRRVIAVDLNPLAVWIMEHEVRPLDINKYLNGVKMLKRLIEPIERKYYGINCRCGGVGVIEWVEYDGTSPSLLQYYCPACRTRRVGKAEKELPPVQEDLEKMGLRRVEIPLGDKTSDLLKRGVRFFHELFPPRNLYLILLIQRAIENLDLPADVKSFLKFTLSSTLKWASWMSHRRGEIIEGWAMHAYWIYPKPLEINVWRQFLNRVNAVVRGKKFSNTYIGSYACRASTFEDFAKGATYLLLQMDARSLPLPDSCVDCVITDPPYGDNVNYAELSDYFLWLNGSLAPKKEEIVINRTRGFTLDDYKAGLEEVFKECHRVLKPGGLVISTFNSKDLRVVGAFLSALSSAGFSYVETSYQPYLKAYTTTFHAMQIDALPFDFVFFFQKSEPQNHNQLDYINCLQKVYEKMELCKKQLKSEREFRMETYPLLLPYLASKDWDEVKLLASSYEKLIERESDFFKSVRKKRTQERRGKSVKTL